VKSYNIRTTVISPDAVATELLDSVTDPDAAARVRAFYADAASPAASFARLVAFAIIQPGDVDINGHRGLRRRCRIGLHRGCCRHRLDRKGLQARHQWECGPDLQETRI
jgi:hypothetical protein